MSKEQDTGTEQKITPEKDTIDRGAAFFAAIAAAAPPGRHILTLSTARGVSQTAFSKERGGLVVIDEKAHGQVLETIILALHIDHVFGAALRSFGGAAAPEAPTEVRGWVVTSFSTRALTAEEVIEAYCVDHATGRIMDPEPGVAYRDGWEITGV